jgi:spore coat protein U-like protein
MMMKISRKIAAATALTLALAPLSFSAMAAQSQTNFRVSAVVAKVCTIQAADLNFGTYDQNAPGAHNANTTIDVTCTPGTDYKIGLSSGGSGNISAREMASPTVTDVLPYGLYRDAGLSQNWGNDIAGSSDIVARTATPGLFTHTVYGSIPANQFVAEATDYLDTITVTIDF